MSRIQKAYYLLTCIVFIFIWNLNSFAAPQIIFIEADEREPNQIEFLEANGFEVTVMEPFRLSRARLATINILNNADLVIIGRSPSSKLYRGDDAEAWHDLITTPVVLNSQYIATDGTKRIDWFKASKARHENEEPEIAYARVDPTNAIFTFITIPSGNSIPWMYAPHDILAVDDDATNGTIAARYGDGDVLIVQNEAGTPIYDGGPSPAGPRTYFGFGNDDGGFDNFFPLTDEAQQVYLNEINRLLGNTMVEVVTVEPTSGVIVDIILSSTSILENSDENSEVGTLSTINPNGGFFYFYSLVSGVGSTDNASFNISGNRLRTSEKFDFETKSSYSIRIQSSNLFSTYQKVFIITVINENESPIDILLSSTEVPDNQVVNTVVGTLSSIDPDIDDSFIYSLVSGKGSDDNSLFNILGDQLRTSVVLNSEIKPTCKIRIRTTDYEGLLYEKAFNLTVIDMDEPPVATNANIIGTDFFIGQLLTADYTYTDPNGDLEGNTTFSWYMADNNLGTGRTLINTSQHDTLTPLVEQGGKWIQFIVHPFDINNREGIGDTSEFRYINAAPVLNDFTLINEIHPDAFAVGEIIRADYTYFDVESDADGMHRFQWYSSNTGNWSDKQSISGADDDIYTIAPAISNKYIALEAVAYAVEGSSPGQIQQSEWHLVSETPSAMISGDIKICEGGTGFLTVALTGDNPPWSFRYVLEGSTDTIEIPDIPVRNSNYQLEVTDTGTYLLVDVSDKKFDFGIVSGTGSVSFAPKPTAELVLDELSICSNDIGIYAMPVKLSGTSPWSISYSKTDQSDSVYISNINSEDFDIELTIHDLGTYRLLHVWDANCVAPGTGKTDVILRESPRAIISGDTIVCPGDTAYIKIELSDDGPWDYYYTLDDGDEIGVYINQSVPSYTHIMEVTQSGVYRLTGVENEEAEGCASGTATVNNFSMPSATIGGDFTVCEGTSINFTVALTGSSPWSIFYQRDFEDPEEVEFITQDQYLLNVKEGGSYSITKVTDGNNCIGSGIGSAQLTVDPAPEVVIHDLDTLYTTFTTLVQFYAEPLGGNFDLSDENIVSTLNDIANFFPAQAGSENSPHRVVYSYQDPETGCFGRDSVIIHVLDKAGNISVKGETKRPERYCSNQDTLLLLGINQNLTIGTFSINGSQDALIDNGNNTAYLIPSNIVSGQRTVFYNFNLNGQPESVSRVFFFEEIKADFTWDNECFTDDTKIKLSDNSFVDQDSEIKSNRWEIRYSDHIVKADTAELEVAFNLLDTYPIEHIVVTKYGCTDTVRKDLILKPTYPIHKKFYYEDFTDGKSDWTELSDGESPVSWTFGTPSGDIFQASDDKAWYTDIQDYSEKENSYVISPCFDFSEVSRPMIKMDIWKAFITNLDGASLQYQTEEQGNWHTLGAVGEGIEWYNSSTIQGIQGDNGDGWTRTELGWQESKHVLDDIPREEGFVRFRIVYGAPSNNNIARDGFAFDDIWIGERTKRVLVEHFTNTGIDSTFKEVNSKFNALINIMKDDVIDLQYHMDRPNQFDPFYLLDGSSSDSRDLYYSLPTSLPYSIIDGGGNNKTEFLIDFKSKNLNASDLELAILGDNSFDIELTTTKLGDNINIDVRVTSLLNQGKKFITVHVVIIERLIKDITSDYGETEFESVVHTMLPEVVGTSYNIDWSLGTSREINLEYYFQHIFNEEEVRIVAFVQDNETREIYQAAMVPAIPPLGIDEKDTENMNSFLVYPNPASRYTNLKFNEQITGKAQIQINDHSGRLVRMIGLNGGDQIHSIDVNEFDPGIYFIRLLIDNEICGVQKLLILGNNR